MKIKFEDDSPFIPSRSYNQNIFLVLKFNLDVYSHYYYHYYFGKSHAKVHIIFFLYDG